MNIRIEMSRRTSGPGPWRQARIRSLRFHAAIVSLDQPYEGHALAVDIRAAAADGIGGGRGAGINRAPGAARAGALRVSGQQPELCEAYPDMLLARNVRC